MLTKKLVLVRQRIESIYLEDLPQNEPFLPFPTKPVTFKFFIQRKEIRMLISQACFLKAYLPQIESAYARLHVENLIISTYRSVKCSN